MKEFNSPILAKYIIDICIKLLNAGESEQIPSKPKKNVVRGTSFSKYRSNSGGESGEWQISPNEENKLGLCWPRLITSYSCV